MRVAPTLVCPYCGEEVDMELLGFDCYLTFKEYHDFYGDNYNEWAAEHVKRGKNRII